MTSQAPFLWNTLYFIGVDGLKSCELKPVSISHSSKLQRQVTATSYSGRSQQQVTAAGHSSKLQLQVTAASYRNSRVYIENLQNDS